jgi:hypothetical protein
MPVSATHPNFWKGGWASSQSLPAQDGKFSHPLLFPESKNFMRGSITLGGWEFCIQILSSMLLGFHPGKDLLESSSMVEIC